MNVPVACWPPTSVAVTVVPVVPLGTVNVQLNDPVLLVVRPPPTVQLEIVTPSKTNPTVLDTVKPVPDTVTVEPTGPCFGLTVILGVVTVNFPVACWLLTSVAVTVVPDVPLGTLNVQLNCPVPPVVKEPLVQLEIVTLSSTRDFSACATEKPAPDTVTVAPTGPCFGLTAILGVVTGNCPIAV
ncbi:MAG: hypothetical protein L3K14_10200 [Thermoplasmata archaeon]|nr:hypothetical protein [Thermoplasmata archaeon]